MTKMNRVVSYDKSEVFLRFSQSEEKRTECFKKDVFVALNTSCSKCCLFRILSVCFYSLTEK